MQTWPTWQRVFGDYLWPAASMPLQVMSQGQPILMTTSSASEAPEVIRRPITPLFDIQLVLSQWVRVAR